jgi:diketogulonate reductase-like aldo/keto reductase
MSIPTCRLASGHEMPLLGLGTWELRRRHCVDAVRKALELGYTHIDTADAYHNHAEIAQALKAFDRSRIFITSKVPPEMLRYEDLLRTCDRNLRELETDYLDLYLIHWPNRRVPFKDTLRAFKELVESGKVRSVGVSNFRIPDLKEARQASDVPISNNQVELHPLLNEKELLDFCRGNGISVTSYCPLARGRALRNKVIAAVAQKCGKTPAQVALRWLLQKGTIVIPKAGSEAHLRENMDIFDWEIAAEDEAEIDAIGERHRVVNL